MKNPKLPLLLFIIALTFSITTSNAQGNWLSTNGNKLIDASGNEVLLAGVNWFGFETERSYFHGLWARDHKSVLQQIKDLGFNCIRVPWHNRMLEDDAVIKEAPNQWGPDAYTGVQPMNVAESTFTKPIELMDELVKWCQANDLKIILDCHSRNPDAYLVEKRWYTEDFTEAQWIADWVFMADRYKNYDAVIAMDINNEPNGKIDNPNGARWGTGDPANDWKIAAEKCGNAILAANPNVLIMVEGIEAYTKPDGTQTSYWWGGNLQGARDFPVTLSKPNKLMYSPHEYGPTVFAQKWFDVPEFPSNMAGIWEEQFNFLNTEGTSPLFVGELGIKGKGGKDEIWFQEFINFIKEKKLHYTFWALNPNSGDTGGILENDWKTVVQWKMDYLEPILSQPIPNTIDGTSTGGELSVNTVKTKPADLTIFPNPAKQSLQITSASQVISEITIVDINGRIIKNNIIDTNVQRISLDTSSYQNGIYLAKVLLKNSYYTLRFTIAK